MVSKMGTKDYELKKIKNKKIKNKSRKCLLLRSYIFCSILDSQRYVPTFETQIPLKGIHIAIAAKLIIQMTVNISYKSHITSHCVSSFCVFYPYI